MQKRTFYCCKKILFPADRGNSKAQLVEGGNHEWQFKFDVTGRVPETVEGLAGNYVAYNLYAVVERDWLSKDLSATKTVRVIRTLSRPALNSAPIPQVRGSRAAFSSTAFSHLLLSMCLTFTADEN